MFGNKIEHKQLFDLIFKGVIILYIILSTIFGFIVDYNSLGIFTNWWLLFVGVVLLVINSLITIIHFKRLSLPFVINSLLNLSLAVLIYFLYQSVV